MTDKNVIDSFTGDYRWLSNFYPCVVKLDDKTYESVEHAYQAAKTLDKSKRSIFYSGITAGKAKREGRNLIIRKDWENVKINVMLDLLRQKFQDPDLEVKLLKTEDKKLIEGNNWSDFFWGICNGKGQNWLGRLLMQVRDELRGKFNVGELDTGKVIKLPSIKSATSLEIKLVPSSSPKIDTETVREALGAEEIPLQNLNNKRRNKK